MYSRLADLAKNRREMGLVAKMCRVFFVAMVFFLGGLVLEKKVMPLRFRK